MNLLGGKEMNKTIKMGSCGLACVVCSAKKEGKCVGCTEVKAADCKIKACTIEKGHEGCYACDAFPCDQSMFKQNKVIAFNEVAKEKGLDYLVQCLLDNEKKGIVYHPEDGSKGAYDILETKEEIKSLIKVQEIK